MRLALFVVHAFCISVVAGKAATGKDGVGLFGAEADNDECRGRRSGIAAQPFRIGGADWLWKPIGAAEDLDRSILSVVAGCDAEVCLLIERQGIPNSGDRLHQLIPTDLFAQIAVSLQCEVAERPTPGDGNKHREEIGSGYEEADKEDAAYSPARPGRTRREPTRGDDRPHRDYRRVGLGDIVEASLADPAGEHRDDVHPGKHAIAAVTEESDETRKREGNGEEIEIEKELEAPVALSTSFADIALMNALEEVIRDEVVVNEPEKIGKKEEERDANSRPEPRAEQMTPSAGKDKANKQAGDEKDDRIFGEKAQADCRSDRKPPARIVRFEQADGEPADQYPPEHGKRGVLKFCGLKDRERREPDGKCGGDLSEALAAKITRHQTADDDQNGLADDGEETEADERDSEEREADAFNKRRHRRISDEAPIEMPRVAQELELIAMETILSIGDDVRESERGGNSDEYEGIAGCCLDAWLG